MLTAFEGLSLVSSRKVPGYELLTCLGVDRVGHLGLGYARLLAYRKRGLTTLPREIAKAPGFAGAEQPFGLRPPAGSAAPDPLGL